jgi:hypothetical protein
VLYLRAESGVLFPRAEGEEALALEPLGARGWLNVVASGVAIGLLAAAFYLVAHPRLSDRWLLGSGVSLASIGAAVLVWLQWLAGDDARNWARRLLRRRLATAVVAAALLASAALVSYLATHRPTVLRILPGTNLVTQIFPGGPRYTVRVWQGDDAEGEPDWEVDSLAPSGAAIGTSERVAGVVLARTALAAAEGESTYLAERRVPAGERQAELTGEWRRQPPAPATRGAARRRRGLPLRVELLCGGRPQALEVPGPLQPRLVADSLEEALELLFIDPSPAAVCP